MAADDWFRNSIWNDEVETLFYQKLERARSQKHQYMVIQASYLKDGFPKVTLRLIDEYFESREDKFHDAQAYCIQANANVSLSKIDCAIEAFKAALSRESEFPNLQTTAYLDYPLLVAINQVEAEYAQATEILIEFKSRIMFPLDKFLWHASLALIENSAEQAKLALEAAKVKRSGFRFHQDVGLVGLEYKSLVKDLCKLAKLRRWL